MKTVPDLTVRHPQVGRTLLGSVCLAFVLMINAPAADAQSQTIQTATGAVSIETIVDELVHPWAIAFLPDGRMLVTERPGRLRIVTQDGDVSQPVSGVPEVFSEGQGGLLDVALDPKFEENKLVYISYAGPGQGGASTAVARGRLEDNALADVEVIFRQQPKVEGEYHFGGRLAFTDDNKLFITMGERFKFEPAQDLSNHLGTIARINPDGSVPDDNPFVGQDHAEPEIWSYGHRNIEAAFVHPDTGQLWVAEMGPRGGDELNLPEAGKNYGWPIVSWGKHYPFSRSGGDISDPPTHPEFAQSTHHWTPVISPSGMIYYTADTIPAWQDNVFIGGLSSQALIRLEIDGEQVVNEEQIDMGARIREVAQAPDGSIYLTTDEENGKILRLTQPAGRALTRAQQEDQPLD